MNIEVNLPKIFFTFDDSKVILYHLEDNLYRIRIKDFDLLNEQDKESCRTVFVNYCIEKKVELLIEEDKEENKLIQEWGFEVFKSKYLYKKDLSIENIPVYNSEFTYQSISEIGLSSFLEVFKKVANDDQDRGVKSEIEFFESIKEAAEDKYNEDWWKVVFLNNEAIGVLMPQIFPDSEIEGTLFHIGLIPNFRQKGLGKILHADGLRFLVEMGVTEYIGSTFTYNLPMLKVFEINECQRANIQYFYNFV